MLARPRPNILTLFWRFVRCEKRHCLVVALVGLFALSGFALRVLEPGRLWWSVVTMTDMDCGDVPPPSSWDILR